MRPRGARLSLERVLALVALLGLFLVAGICVVLIAGARDGGDAEDGEPSPVAATPTPKPKPTTTPKPKPTAVPLTPEQRAQRRAAAQTVRGQGYDPVSLTAYHPDQNLRVLLGATSANSRAAGVPAGRRAFFFVAGNFVRTDAETPSAKLRIIRQTSNSVTLAYGLAGGAQTRVRFRWDGASLIPQSPVPEASQRQA